MHPMQDKILLTEGIAEEDKFGNSMLENGEVYMPSLFVDQPRNLLSAYPEMSVLI